MGRSCPSGPATCARIGAVTGKGLAGGYAAICGVFVAPHVAEPIREAKCFHAGGKAKKWLVDAEKAGLLVSSRAQEEPTEAQPYRAYTRAKFDRKQLALKVARALGVEDILATRAGSDLERGVDALGDIRRL